MIIEGLIFWCKKKFVVKNIFLNVPSVRQEVTIFCAPKNIGTNVYNALKKKFEDILKNGREIGRTIKPSVKFCALRTNILDNMTFLGGF